VQTRIEIVDRLPLELSNTIHQFVRLRPDSLCHRCRAIRIGLTRNNEIDGYRHPGGIFAWKGAKYPVEKAE
jgi:hypothetical protein